MRKPSPPKPRCLQAHALQDRKFRPLIVRDRTKYDRKAVANGSKRSEDEKTLFDRI